MDLRLSEEQGLIKSAARAFLAAECPMSHVREMPVDATGYSAALWRKMAELGWMGIAFPETYDGLGDGFLDLCLLIEEMGRVLLPSPFLPTVVLCGMPILHFGSDEQKSAYLPAIAAGRRILTFAELEPGASWGAHEVSCVATPKGDGFVLSGRKMFVPYASAADDLLVVARRAGADERALTLFLVDAASGGISCERLETVGADHLERVTFEGVQVGSSRVLGEIDQGRPIVEAVAHWGSASRCAEMLGGAERVLEMTLDYAKERHQFGHPIGSFQAVQHHCANMAIDVLSSRFITYEAIWCLAEGLDASEIVPMAKAWTGDAYCRVCRLGHQLHGAIGYTREHDLHLYFRHATASDLAFGDSDYNREQVAHQLGL